MNLSQLKPSEGSKKKRKRIGRGPGSGHGKTSCKGNKGQNSRSGGGVRRGFEGGQMPLQRRLPKRGFHNNFKTEFTVINISSLNKFEEGSVITPAELIKCGLVTKSMDGGVKILGNGDIDRKLTVKANKFSKSAAEKIRSAGGEIEVI